MGLRSSIPDLSYFGMKRAPATCYAVFRLCSLFSGLLWMTGCGHSEQELPRGTPGFQYSTSAVNVGNFASNGGAEESLVSWGVLGSARMTRSNKISHSGIYSVLIDGRSEPWHGLTFSFYPLAKERTYHFSVWAQLAAGQDPAELRLTLRTRTTEAHYTRLAEAVVTDKNWVQLGGAYTYNEGAMEFVYVESDSPTVRYHLDDMVIVEKNWGER